MDSQVDGRPDDKRGRGAYVGGQLLLRSLAGLVALVSTGHVGDRKTLVGC